MINILSKKLVYLGLLFSTSLPAQIWFQIGGANLQLECPDQIEIKDNTYKIKNECYGSLDKDYLLESGKITFTKNQLMFSERQVLQRSFMQSKIRDESFEVQIFGDSVLLRKEYVRFNFIILESPR